MTMLTEALKLAKQYHRANHLNAAEQVYREILENQPDFPEALYGLGLLAQQRGQNQSAEKLFKVALQAQPDFFKAWLHLGNLYQAQGRLPEAVNVYQQALTIQPDAAPIYNNLGYTLQQQGKFDTAIACYQKSLELQPNCTEADVNLGNVLYIQGKLSTEQQAHYALLNNKLGIARRQANDLTNAVSYYRQAIAMQPDLVDVHYNLGTALQEQGELDKASDCYQKVLELNSSYTESINQQLLKMTRSYHHLHSELGVISLKPEKNSRGNVLLSYIIDPFLLKSGESIPHNHTEYWESFQIAATFLEFGYCVDVISHRNVGFIPQKHYSFFIDVRWNLARLAPLLNKDCIKIFLINCADILFQNAAAANRLLALQQRKGITLNHQRHEMCNLGIEDADCATVLGNEFTVSTYRYANKPIYRIPISTPVVYPWSESKDFEACRKRFLWFGGVGMVHKGLDLVLDAFVDMPEYHLTVCGPVKQEKEFEQAFYQELYQTPNIHTYGWIDITSPEFINLTNSCIGLVYPSCSEGGGGSVITCMHAGLIPIVSYEASVDVESQFGVMLKNSSIEEIKDSVRKIANLPALQLKQMSHKAWEFARANHTREKFAKEYRKTVETLINTPILSPS